MRSVPRDGIVTRWEGSLRGPVAGCPEPGSGSTGSVHLLPGEVSPRFCCSWIRIMSTVISGQDGGSSCDFQLD